jgi:hypothetical protein
MSLAENTLSWKAAIRLEEDLRTAIEYFRRVIE